MSSDDGWRVEGDGDIVWSNQKYISSIDIVCVVSPQGEGYDITMCSKEGVPKFTPDLPEPAHITKDATSRDFLLHKREALKYNIALAI